MTLKPLKLMGLSLIAGVALAVAYGVFGPNTHSFAHGSSIISTGAFTGSGAQIGNSIPNGVASAGQYEAFIGNLLYDVGYGGIPGSNYNMYGAAFLVETMLHGEINYNADVPLVLAARSDYTQWAHLVSEYESAGRITWFRSTTLPAGAINSMHVCINGPFGYCWDRAVYQNNNYNNGGWDAGRFLFYNNSSSEPSTLIVFTNPDGTTYQIRRECSNVVGSVKPLKELGWNLDGQTLLNTPSGGSSIYANETATFTSQIRDLGPASADNFTWYVRYCWDACGGGFSSGYGTLASGASTQANGGAWTTKNIWPYAPNGSSAHTKLCVWIAFSNSAGPGTGEDHGGMTCATILPLTPGCGGATVSPGTFDPTDPYALTAIMNFAGGQPGAAYVNSQSNFFIHISGPGVNYVNDNVPATAGGSAATSGIGTLTASVSPGPTNNAGNYTVTYGITGSVSPKTCTDSFRVAFTPYFSVSGGDVAAGPGFGTACVPSLSSITANNLGASSGYYGASSQLGAFSLKQITGFATNTLLNGSGTGGSASGGSAAQPSGLAFSNRATSGTIWGTTFGKDPTDDPADNPSFCVSDYHGVALSGTTLALPLGAFNQAKLNMLTSGATYVYNGDLQTVGSLSLGGAGQPSRVTIVVNGNVQLNSNVTYAGYNYVSGTSTASSVPQFQLIVKGNIFVDHSVTTLAGFYVAQGSGTNGTMYTCSSGLNYLTYTSGDTATYYKWDPNYYNDCRSPLTIYGSVAARHITLNRSGGNWKATASVSNTPAEKIVFTPELWLGSQSATLANRPSYDAITNLPPIF